MARVAALIIVGLMLVAGGLPVHASGAGSDWPSLNADPAQSNSNPAEHTLNAANVLKLKVRWTAPDPAASYPVVAGGRVYLPFLKGRTIQPDARDARTGKRVRLYSQDALGGMLVTGGMLITAGKSLQQVDPATGEQIASATGSPAGSRSTFVAPLADHKLVIAGYYPGTGKKSTPTLYAFTSDLGRTVWKVPSPRAQGTVASSRVLTDGASGSALYDESSGHRVTVEANLHTDWFAGSMLEYGVAAVKQGNATLYAFDGTGHRAWSTVVGPRVVTDGWPHAVSSLGVYVQTLKPRVGIEALDPTSGTLLWRQGLPNVIRLAVANGLVYALTYALGQPVRLVLLRADTGKPIGAVVLATGYYAFPAANGLMVADGMVFLRAVGPKGPVLLALGLPAGA